MHWAGGPSLAVSTLAACSSSETPLTPSPPAARRPSPARLKRAKASSKSTWIARIDSSFSVRSCLTRLTFVSGSSTSKRASITSDRKSGPRRAVPLVSSINGAPSSSNKWTARLCRRDNVEKARVTSAERSVEPACSMLDAREWRSGWCAAIRRR
eukprot:scaffold7339_cov124-Isochrysis_galbana.AAC.2